MSRFFRYEQIDGANEKPRHNPSIYHDLSFTKDRNTENSTPSYKRFVNISEQKWLPSHLFYIADITSPLS